MPGMGPVQGEKPSEGPESSDDSSGEARPVTSSQIPPPQRTVTVTSPSLGQPESRSRLGAGMAWLIFLMYVVSQIVAGFGVGVVYGIYQGMKGAGMPTEIDPVWLLAGGAIGVALSGVVVLTMARASFPRGPEGMASIGWRRATRTHTLTGAAIGLGLSVILPVFGSVFPPSPDQAMGPLAEAASSSGWAQLVLVFLALMLAPPIEEFLFRGVMFAGFSRSWGPALASVLVTVLFAAAHLPEVMSYWPALVSIAIVGVAALVMRRRSGSLVPAIALHATYNVVLVGLALLTGGFSS